MAQTLSSALVAIGIVVAMTGAARSQVLGGLRASLDVPQASSICGLPVLEPSMLPPPNVSPVVYMIAPCFERQGGVARVSPADYLRDIQLPPSLPSQGLWVPYNSAAERVIFEDFQRLWANHLLAELSVDIRDYRFSNGVIGKLVTYNITERD
jgi:hypothetical protein